MASNSILLRLSNFAYKRSRKPLGRLPLKRVLTLEETFSLTHPLHPAMTGKKTMEKGKKPIASSNTPTPMTSDRYAMDAGFTLVTRSKAKLSKKQAEVITPMRPSASSTRHLPCTQEVLKQHFWWKNMKRDVAEFLSNCLVCQQVKASR